MAADKGDSRGGPVRTEHACRPFLPPCRSIRVFFAPPHRDGGPRMKSRAGSIAPIHTSARTTYLCSWNLGRNLPRRIHATAREVVAQEHWCSSAFANTDLDLQLRSMYPPSRTSCSRPRKRAPPIRASIRGSSLPSSPVPAQMCKHRAQSASDGEFADCHEPRAATLASPLR